MAAHLFSKSNSKNLCFPILKFGGYMRLQSTKPCNPQLKKKKEKKKRKERIHQIILLNSHKRDQKIDYKTITFDLCFPWP